MDKSTLNGSPLEADETSALNRSVSFVTIIVCLRIAVSSSHMAANLLLSTSSLLSSPPSPSLSSASSNVHNDLRSPVDLHPSSVEEIEREMMTQVLPDDLQSLSKDGRNDT